MAQVKEDWDALMSGLQRNTWEEKRPQYTPSTGPGSTLLNAIAADMGRDTPFETLNKGMTRHKRIGALKKAREEGLDPSQGSKYYSRMRELLEEAGDFDGAARAASKMAAEEDRTLDRRYKEAQIESVKTSTEGQKTSNKFAKATLDTKIELAQGQLKKLNLDTDIAEFSLELERAHGKEIKELAIEEARKQIQRLDEQIKSGRYDRSRLKHERSMMLKFMDYEAQLALKKEAAKVAAGADFSSIKPDDSFKKVFEGYTHFSEESDVGKKMRTLAGFLGTGDILDVAQDPEDDDYKNARDTMDRVLNPLVQQAWEMAKADHASGRFMGTQYYVDKAIELELQKRGRELVGTQIRINGVLHDVVERDGQIFTKVAQLSGANTDARAEERKRRVEQVAEQNKNKDVLPGRKVISGHM